jgi:hypothetical protein
MASFVTPQNGDDALAEHVAQLTEVLSGLRNIPISVSGINDAAAYALSVKNAGAGSKDAIFYAADGTTVLLQVDSNGVKASAAGGPAAPILTTTPGSITTAMLAPNAVTQLGSALGTTVNPATTSSSFVDIPEMTRTLTTVGGPLLCLLQINLQTDTTGSGGVLALNLDGADAISWTVRFPSPGLPMPLLVMHLFGASAGSHTIKGRWAVLVSGTLTNPATARLLLVEEIRR